MSEWTKLKKENYRKDCIAHFRNGVIDFAPKRMKEVENGSFKNYDEYLEVQMKSCDCSRQYFAHCYYHSQLDYEFRGQIERFAVAKEKVLFKRIMIDGMHMDGTGFRGKEDHVWMDMAPFRQYEVGDSLAFGAEICRYMKKSSGKLIDYDLKNPVDIHKVKGYKVPTDEELIDQQIDRLVCETCRYYDHCFMGNCIANEVEREKRKETLKSLEPGKFTPFTVMLAYELEYRMMMQMGGFTYEESDKNAPIVRKIIEICEAHPVYYVGDVKEALARMMYPDKPRLYIGDVEK